MKQFSTILNVVLILAVAFLYYHAFGGKKTGTPAIVKSSTATVNSGSPQTAIAYVDLDSLNEKIIFIKEKRKELETEQKAIETEWQSGYRNLEAQKNTFNIDYLNANTIQLNEGEAAFAASNTNISSFKNKLWIATGGKASRIIKLDLRSGKMQVFDTPFIQGSSSQGIYSIDFFNRNFGIAVGGDYTKQAENVNNIATTYDGGKTWTIQASGKNGGYKTCVKFRPKSKGKDIIAVGDQNIELSRDYGKTWQTISNEKGLYVCEWIDENTLVFAGKNRIIKMQINFRY